MTREQAQTLIAAVVALDTPLGAVDGALSALDPGSERDDLRRTLGTIMMSLYADLMIPALQQYPELDPDRP